LGLRLTAFLSFTVVVPSLFSPFVSSPHPEILSVAQSCFLECPDSPRFPAVANFLSCFRRFSCLLPSSPGFESFFPSCRPLSRSTIGRQTPRRFPKFFLSPFFCRPFLSCRGLKPLTQLVLTFAPLFVACLTFGFDSSPDEGRAFLFFSFHPRGPSNFSFRPDLPVFGPLPFSTSVLSVFRPVKRTSLVPFFFFPRHSCTSEIAPFFRGSTPVT